MLNARYEGEQTGLDTVRHCVIILLISEYSLQTR